MLKTLARLEAIVENKVGHFLLENDTSIAHAKEMCLQFIKFLGQVEDNAKAAQEAQKASEEKPIDEPKPAE